MYRWDIERGGIQQYYTLSEDGVETLDVLLRFGYPCTLVEDPYGF